MISPRTSLVVYAALLWYTGMFALAGKGTVLLMQAAELMPESLWPFAVPGASLTLGGVKARYIFLPSCRKNLDRIRALNQPRFWQCYRPEFFVALAVMIVAGGTLSRIAAGQSGFLLVVAGLDLSLAVGLLGGSILFWKNENIQHQPR